MINGISKTTSRFAARRDVGIHHVINGDDTLIVLYCADAANEQRADLQYALNLETGLFELTHCWNINLTGLPTTLRTERHLRNVINDISKTIINAGIKTTVFETIRNDDDGLKALVVDGYHNHVYSVLLRGADSESAPTTPIPCDTYRHAIECARAFCFGQADEWREFTSSFNK